MSLGLSRSVEECLGQWSECISVARFKIQATDSAVFEFMKEIRNYAENGITEKELAFTKSSIGQSEALLYFKPA